MSITIPEATRPHIPGYGIPKDKKGLLTWDWVSEQMATARNYWVATVSPDGAPHTVPVWGVWVDDTLFFGGGPDTRWSRNLMANPKVAVHLESGSEVVIIQGEVERVIDPEPDLLKRIDDVYEAKYGMRHGAAWKLIAHIAFAWEDYPTTTTRWVFKA